MSGDEDLYAVLDCTPSAGPAELRAAHRRLALRWHPDRNPADLSRAGERMRVINDAYAVLSHPAQRRAYDAQRCRAEHVHLEVAYSKQTRVSVTTSRLRYVDAAGRVIDLPRDSITHVRVQPDRSAATLVLHTRAREHRFQLPVRIALAVAKALVPT